MAVAQDREVQVGIYSVNAAANENHPYARVRMQDISYIGADLGDVLLPIGCLLLHGELLQKFLQ